MPSPALPWLNAALAFRDLLLFALAATANGQSICIVLNGFTKRQVRELILSLAMLMPPDQIGRLPKGTRSDLKRAAIDAIRVMLCESVKEIDDLALHLTFMGVPKGRTRPLVLCGADCDNDSLPGLSITVCLGAVGGEEGFEWVLQTLKQHPQVYPPTVTCTLPAGISNSLKLFEQSTNPITVSGRSRRSREVAEALVRGAAVYRCLASFNPEDTIEATPQDYETIRSALQRTGADSCEVDIKPDAAALVTRCNYFKSGTQRTSVTVELLRKLGDPNSEESDEMLRTWCALHTSGNARTEFELLGHKPGRKGWIADPDVLKSHLREITPKMIRSHLSTLVKDDHITMGPRQAHGAQTYVFPKSLPQSASVFDHLPELGVGDTSPPAQPPEPLEGTPVEGSLRAERTEGAVVR